MKNIVATVATTTAAVATPTAAQATISEAVQKAI